MKTCPCLKNSVVDQLATLPLHVHRKIRRELHTYYYLDYFRNGFYLFERLLLVILIMPGRTPGAASHRRIAASSSEPPERHYIEK